jgi:hypothetical protein
MTQGSRSAEGDIDFATAEEVNPRAGRTGCPRSRLTRGALWVAATLGSYVVVLAILLYLGRHVSLPSERQLNSQVTGGLNVATRELIGRGDPTDFLVDYASARALVAARDPYDVSARLIHDIGLNWPVGTANPHPPTAVTLVMPTTLLPYHIALAAWELAMIYAIVGTMWLLRVRLLYAIPAGIAIGLTYPGAYGISNIVPVIGLGIAIAYRWRNMPVIAGLGIALAAAPKSSGLILVIPFLLAGRLRTVGWTAFWYGLFATIPLMLDHHIWSAYLKAGTLAIRLNENHVSNGSLLYLGRSSGLPDVVSLGILGIIVCLVAIARRDMFWPVAWATVAMLPIAWMYSLMTFLPMIVWAIVRSPRRSAGLAILAVAFTVSAAPQSLWTPIAFPIVAAIVLLLVVTAETDARGEAVWLPPRFDPFKSWPVLDVSRIHPRIAGRERRLPI